MNVVHMDVSSASCQVGLRANTIDLAEAPSRQESAGDSLSWHPQESPPESPQITAESGLAASKSCVCNASRLQAARLLTEGL